jgi:hypothetical protein
VHTVHCTLYTVCIFDRVKRMMRKRHDAEKVRYTGHGIKKVIWNGHGYRQSH